MVPNDKGMTLHKEIRTEQENLSKKTNYFIYLHNMLSPVIIIYIFKKKKEPTQTVITGVKRDDTALGWWYFSW